MKLCSFQKDKLAQIIILLYLIVIYNQMMYTYSHKFETKLFADNYKHNEQNVG